MSRASLFVTLFAVALVACSVLVSAVPYPDDSPYQYLNQYAGSMSYQPRERKAGHLSNMMRIGRRSDPWMSRETRETNENSVNALRGRIWLLP
uniref:Neuropeptide-Like Protein n=1 Tax=Steinernema glaseri TaxID=37863 RepID=A0A1I7YER5_9BILA